MATGSTFTELLDCPSSIQGDETPRVLRANFGDGYSQRAGDGLNAQLRTFQVAWSDFSDVDIATLQDGFRALGGYQAFNWTPPKDSLPGKFIAPTWKKSASRPNASSLTASFQEVADL